MADGHLLAGRYLGARAHDGGVGNTRCGEIRVENMILGPSGRAGTACNGQPAPGIEQPELGHPPCGHQSTTATGGTLAITSCASRRGRRSSVLRRHGHRRVPVHRGLLSTATWAGADRRRRRDLRPDSPSYTVVIAFASEADTWQYGGVLTVDNFFSRPPPNFANWAASRSRDANGSCRRSVGCSRRAPRRLRHG